MTALTAEGLAADLANIDNAEPLGDTIARLVAMSPIEYDQARETEAKRLNIRVSTLDSEVSAKRNGDADDDADDLVDDVTPWPQEVDGQALAAEIEATLNRYVMLPSGASTALTLWIIGAYAFDAFSIYPKLLGTSPEKRCGKSTLLSAIFALTPRALPASNITAAAMFRCIDAWQPTLLIDEADTFLAASDELRGIINSGHQKSTAHVIRVVGDNHEPKKFSTWTPTGIFMIGMPKDTIVDRSIVIQMRRRLPGESVEKMPLDIKDKCKSIRQQCQRWADDHFSKLKTALPQLPVHGNDRLIDNWTPLCAIAELIGIDVMGTFRALNTDDDDDGIGPMILSDIRDANISRIHSVDLVQKLINLEDRPWSEWRHGKPLTTNSLARLLRPFKIKAAQIKLGLINRNGYTVLQFHDAFDRYLPSTTPQTSTTLQPANDAASRHFQNSTGKKEVEFQKSRKPSNDAACRVVEVKNGGTSHSGYTAYEVGLQRLSEMAEKLKYPASDLASYFRDDLKEIAEMPRLQLNQMITDYVKCSQ